MKQHTKIYLEHFGYDVEDPFVPCEICEQRAVDIHHISARGMGGSHKKDEIENLMALCRECHIQYGDIKELIPTLQEIHLKRLYEHY
jgi:5-methylcytosine-specific restriction endonuclease McrA